MIYLVSGVSRSGTSMMMRCLEAGGLPAVYDHHQDWLNVQYGNGEYLPNPNGFYACERDEFYRPDFADAYAGKLVKVPWAMLLRLPQATYRLAFMLRDPAEIFASMRRFIPTGFGGDELVTALYPTVTGALQTALLARGDMQVRTVQYAAVVKNPATAFAGLGWPIDAQAAAAMVQPELYRFRLEAT